MDTTKPSIASYLSRWSKLSPDCDLLLGYLDEDRFPELRLWEQPLLRLSGHLLAALLAGGHHLGGCRLLPGVVVPILPAVVGRGGASVSPPGPDMKIDHGMVADDN